MEKNPLNNIVKSLSKDEVRFFKLFLKRTNNKNRKDVQLFNFLRKISKNYQTNDALKVVDTNPNNLYQIRNRLYHEVNNSMIWQHIWKDEQSKSFSYVLLARVYRNKGELQLAYHFLQKAEREADSSNLYQLLSIIYSDIIDLSHELVSIDLDKYIALKGKNIKLISEIEEIDILLSKVMYDIKTKQNLSNSKNTLLNELKQKYKQILNEEKLFSNPKFKIRLFKLYSRYLLQIRQYNLLEKFLIETYFDFENNGIFNRNLHNEKLSLLTYLTNCLYTNKKYDQSLRYAQILMDSMNEFDAFLYNKYIFYYYNSLILNYSKTDKKKALDYLNKASKDEDILKLPTYSLFIYLNKALVHYYLKDYKNARVNLSRLLIQKDFLSIDNVFQLKIMITDLMVRIDNLDYDILERIKNIKNRYYDLLIKTNYIRENEIINILQKLANKLPIVKCKDKFLKLLSDNESDELDIISYNRWLKKVE